MVTQPVLVFDTETTALNGVVIQLAYNVYEYDMDGKSQPTTRRNLLLRLPPRHRIQRKAYLIHRIGEADLRQRGVDAILAMCDFATCVRSVVERGGRIVAHNAAFDCRALQRTWDAHMTERRRLTFADARSVAAGSNSAENDNPFHDMEQIAFCTMNRSRGYVKAVNKAGSEKNPRNDELYTFLFGKSPSGPLHDAANDIAITAASYFEGSRREWW